jgi:hypothetical protein
MYKTTKTTTTYKKALGKSFDAVFDSLKDTFDKASDLFSDVSDDEDETPFGCAINDGTVSITSNNGHVVVEGDIKSLKINGKDILL